MKLKIWQVDAFASKVLEGNPAAIVPLESWLADDLMQRIAAENNVAETAFFVKTGPGRYEGKFPAKDVGTYLATLTYTAMLFALPSIVAPMPPAMPPTSGSTIMPPPPPPPGMGAIFHSKTFL